MVLIVFITLKKIHERTNNNAKINGYKTKNITT